MDHQRWNQSVADLRHLALSATHPRSRERFFALHEIAQSRCPTTVAGCTGRRAQTVMGWVHAYNERGPEALSYQRTGGRPPLPIYRRRTGRAGPYRAAPGGPLAGAEVKPRWTLRLLVSFVRTQFARRCGRESIRRVLHRLKLSWKKARKLLARPT